MLFKHHPNFYLTLSRRLLISQDHHEIWIVIAQYDQPYLDYIHNKPTPAEEMSFMTMTEYGPFLMYDKLHMESFAVFILAFALSFSDSQPHSPARNDDVASESSDPFITSSDPHNKQELLQRQFGQLRIKDSQEGRREGLQIPKSPDLDPAVAEDAEEDSRLLPQFLTPKKRRRRRRRIKVMGEVEERIKAAEEMKMSKGTGELKRRERDELPGYAFDNVRSMITWRVLM